MGKKLTLRSVLRRLFFITVGAFIMGLGLEGVLIPNHIIDGGVTGISMIISHVTGFHLGPLLFALNVPFFILGYRKMGQIFTISMFYGISVLSISTYFFKYLPTFTSDSLLAVVFGGLMLGVGVGLVIRNGGVLDGTETLSILLEKKLPFSVGEIIMIMNVIIFSVAASVFTLNSALYSMITYYIASKTIDAVVKGFDDMKIAYVITDLSKEMSDAIVDQLGRGVTFLNGEGSFSGDSKKVLLCAFTRLEESQMKDIIREVDRNAFIIINDVAEVHGGRFKKKTIH